MTHGQDDEGGNGSMPLTVKSTNDPDRKRQAAYQIFIVDIRSL
jgi:hypothetical protein